MRTVIRVFVYDAVRLSGDATRHVLGGRDRLEVTGSGHELDQVCSGPEAATADVILVRAGGDPLGDVRAIKGSRPGHLIVVTGVEDSAAEIVPLIEAGASGYVPERTTPAELAVVIEAVYDATFSCSPRVARAVFERVWELARAGPPAGRPDLDRLSDREQQIVDRIGLGMSNKEIARDLRLALHTVKNHVHRILGKLRMSRRREVARAVRVGAPGRAGAGVNPF